MCVYVRVCNQRVILLHSMGSIIVEARAVLGKDGAQEAASTLTNSLMNLARSSITIQNQTGATTVQVAGYKRK